MIFDACCTDALGVSYDRAKWRELSTLSGGEQKRLALEALLRGPDEVLLLDEPDNYLDVPGKRWLEDQLATTQKIGAAGQPRPRAAGADRQTIAVLELGAAGNSVWIHGSRIRDLGSMPGGNDSPGFEELRRRWDEEHAEAARAVLLYKNKAAYNSGMASRYQAAQTRLAKFEEAGPPQAVPLEQRVSMRLSGGRTGKRAVVVDSLELTGLMKPFDTRSGSATGWRCWARTARASRISCGCWPAAGPILIASTSRSMIFMIAPVPHTGKAKLGARVRPGWFAQTHDHPELLGRTLLEILHRGDDHRAGMGREEASRKLDRYELAKAAEQRFESLSGGQQARFQILLLELSGATLLLLDEPTDNLDLESAEALEQGLDAFEGTVIAVTHDRWFARGFDRLLVFGADGSVYESTSRSGTRRGSNGRGNLRRLTPHMGLSRPRDQVMATSLSSWRG